MEAAERDVGQLDAVLADFTNRLRLGDVPSVDDYLARHPVLADDLRELLPVIAATESLKGRRRSKRSRGGEETPSFLLTGDTASQHAPPAVGSSSVPSRQALAFLDTVFLPPTAPGEIGRIGNYRVLELLGRGGMGAVFLAEDIRLHRQVALKVMLPDVASQVGSGERFLREARAAAKLDHDHIVTIYQVDVDRGIPFIAMALLRGQSLEDRIPQAPPTLLETVRIGRQVADGLAAAHARGIIHRDIKPANIWLEDRVAPVREAGDPGASATGGSTQLLSVPSVADTPGSPAPPHENVVRVKLLDFGLARPVSADASVTQSGIVVGTPAYMSPEQARGEPMDDRADLFSLGVVLYRLTTGRMPFPGATAASVLMALGSETPAAPAASNADVPAPLSDLILSMLAKNAVQRPPSAAAVSQRLREIEKTMMSPPESSTARPTSDIAPPRRPVRRWTAVAAGLTALAGIAILSFILLRIESPDGDLVLKIHDDALMVTVHEGGKATIVDKSTRRQFSIKANKGEVQIFDRDGEHLLVTKQFEVRRGGKTVLEVTPAEIAAARDTLRGLERWRPLFNGKDLTGWKYPPELPGDWTVVDGILVGRGRPGWLFSNEEFDDFHLLMEMKLGPLCDTGIFFWTPFNFKRFVDGKVNPVNWHEVNLSRRNGAATLGSIDGQGVDTVLTPGPAPREWFTVEVIATGKTIVSKIGGEPVATLTFPEARRGHLAIQTPIDPMETVWIRHIDIKTPKKNVEPKPQS